MDEAMAGRRFSPQTWVRYWIVCVVVLCPASLIFGIVENDPRGIFLGVAIAVIGVAMIGFWRRAEVDRQQRG